MVEEGVPKEKILVNPCGVALDQFRPGIKADKVFRIIQCGSINHRKGVHLLLRAFHELRLPNAELWLVGGDPEISELAPIIKRYRTDSVRFIGAVPQSELPLLYQQASISVLASVADGFGMVVPQAMACGLPVITRIQSVPARWVRRPWRRPTRR